MQKETQETNALIPDFEPLLDSEQAAELLGGIHPKTLQRMVRKDEIPGYLIAGRWFFRTSELDEWVRSRVHSGSHPCRVN